jgi:SAM-dependent methyltransferase
MIRHGIDPTTAGGREQARAYFRTLMTRINGEVGEYAQTIESARGGAELAARSTLFRTRGLSSDTSIRPDFAVDHALDSLGANGTLRAGSVRRIGVIGPGLDFTDKAEGYDFYPQQTTQPIAVIDSVLRLGLARSGDVRLATFDVNPRVNAHLEDVRQRASAGTGYTLVLPHDREDRWQTALTAFWKSFGQHVGAAGQNARAAFRRPSGVDVRALTVRPDVILSIEPHDLNVVVQRLPFTGGSDRFDLIVATNVLVYYSVFEQSLALANIAAMLRPGGVLLSNNVLVELPTTPLHAIGHSTSIYSDRPDDRDEIIWYVRR